MISPRQKIKIISVVRQRNIGMNIKTSTAKEELETIKGVRY